MPEFAAQGVDPSVVLEKAVQRYEPKEHDAVWCVFDRDEHTHASAARQRGKDRHFEVAFSNPCVEIWYILHFGYSTRPMTSDQARKQCEKRIPGYTKSTPVYDLLRDKQYAAVAHAQQLRQKHDKVVNKGKARNPYTDFDRLVISLRKLAAGG